MSPTDPITPLDIQKQSKKRGITQQEIAEETGVSPMHVSKMVRFRKTNHRLMQVIARKIGMACRLVLSHHFNNPNRRTARAA